MFQLHPTAESIWSRCIKGGCLLLLACLGVPCQANPSLGSLPVVALQFDELSFQTVDDLSISGVTFDFKIGGVDSTEAFYASYGPGTLTNLTDPSLTGDATGVLTMDFDFPTPLLEFAVALSTADALTPGATVELLDSSLQAVDVVSIDTSALIGNLGFSEGTFAYDGPPVSRAVVQFQHQPGSFALDNLRFVVIPEPSAASLAAVTALASLVCSRLRRFRATND